MRLLNLNAKAKEIGIAKRVEADNCQLDAGIVLVNFESINKQG
jgi:hypothetical protein